MYSVYVICWMVINSPDCKLNSLGYFSVLPKGLCKLSRVNIMFTQRKYVNSPGSFSGLPEGLCKFSWVYFSELPEEYMKLSRFCNELHLYFITVDLDSTVKKK